MKKMAHRSRVKIMRSWILASLLGLIFVSHSEVMAQEAGAVFPELKELRDQFTELWDDVPRPKSDFDALYLSELEKAAAKAQEEGELLLLVALKAEIKAFPSRGPVGDELSEHAELARLQKIYNENFKKIEADSREKRIQLIVAYRKQIDELQKELTKAGEIERALEVHQEGERMKEVFSELVNNFGTIPSIDPNSGSDPGIPARPVIPGPPAPGPPVEDVKAGYVGRYVRIVNPKKGVLFLSEFEVISEGANVARGGKAVQSSAMIGKGGPELAIDGNTDGDFANGSTRGCPPPGSYW